MSEKDVDPHCTLLSTWVAVRNLLVKEVDVFNVQSSVSHGRSSLLALELCHYVLCSAIRLEHVQIIATLRRVMEFVSGRAVAGRATALANALHFNITSSIN
jgi:hypothetical protein